MTVLVNFKIHIMINFKTHNPFTPNGGQENKENKRQMSIRPCNLSHHYLLVNVQIIFIITLKRPIETKQ